MIGPGGRGREVGFQPLPAVYKTSDLEGRPGHPHRPFWTLIGTHPSRASGLGGARPGLRRGAACSAHCGAVPRVSAVLEGQHPLGYCALTRGRLAPPQSTHIHPCGSVSTRWASEPGALTQRGSWREGLLEQVKGFQVLNLSG